MCEQGDDRLLGEFLSSDWDECGVDVVMRG
jgi:hypothetical protein